MVFEKETNLYQDAAIRSKFTSQDTQFSVIQGKISYLITDSEIATYDDGKGTITSRMNSAENTVSEHSSTISSMQSEIDGVTGDVEEFHSTYNAFVQNTEGTFSQVSETLSTKTHVFRDQPAPPYNEGDFWIKDKELYVCVNSKEESESYSAADWIPSTKGRVFTTTPTVPYNAGDMWMQGASGDIKICTVTRTSGSYSASDWSNASRYIGTADLSTWYDDNLKDVIEGLEDGEIKTYYQPNDPSSGWSAEEKRKHEADIWYCSKTTGAYAQKYYRWNGAQWQQMTAMPPSDIVKTISGKGTIFASQPTTAQIYHVGDLWVNAKYPPSTGSMYNNEILRCNTAKAAGSPFSIDHWEKASKYTDDSTLTNWLTNTYATDKRSLQTQIDGKIETWSQANDPSSAWGTQELQEKHYGDMWFCSATTGNRAQKYYRWDGSQWLEVTAEPPTAMVNTINAKANIFTGSGRPAPPYKIGDLWFNSTSDNTGEIYTCVVPRESGGSPAASDWRIRNKYTDDSTFTNWQTETYDSFINQLPGQINFQVTGSKTTAAGDVYTGKGDIILNINDTLQSEAKIDADKITLDGDLVVNAINDGSVQINASHIAISSYPSLDSAIDSKSGIYKGDAVPTNSNSPASGWTTDAVRAKHVSDIYVRTNGDEYQYVPGKNGLLITFSSKCATERNYDFAQIYFQINGTTYRTDALTGGRGGTENKIAGVQVFVPSNIFWLYWESDSSNTDYGFSIDSIEKVYSDKAYATRTGTLPSITATEVSGDTYPETAHPYTNNQKLLWKYTYSSSAFEDQTYGWARRQDSGFNEIRMQGYVTFTNLGTSGATAINGDNITTGTINADRVMGGIFKAGGSAAGSSGKNGAFEVYSSADARIGRIDSSGIYFGNIISSLSSPNFKVDNSGYVTCKGATVTTAADSQACNMQLSTSELSLYRNGVRIGSVGFEINQNSAFATLSGSASAKIKNSTSSAFVGCDSNGHITLGTGRYGKVYVQNTYDQGRYSVALTNENTEIIFNVQNNRLYIVSGGATYYLTLNR